MTEASITGESFPVEKRPGELAANTPVARRTNWVYQGSSVRSGTAKILITATGQGTTLGAIASQIGKIAVETEFARGIHHFGTMLLRVVFVIVLAVFVVNLLMQRPLVESLMFAAALAVGMSPELLPVIISVTLSRGAQTLAGSGVLIRRLSAIENLGAMDTLCADKTGTLTTGETQLYDTLDAGGQSCEEILRVAFLNAWFETGIENPLDSALLEAGKKKGLGSLAYLKVDEIPYDFMRRCLSVVVQDPALPQVHQMVTKGAVPNVMGMCTKIMANGKAVSLSDTDRSGLMLIFKKKSQEGFRVLALATRDFEPKSDYGRADEANLTFRGFLVFHDPPRTDVQITLDRLRVLGVAVKIITGDNRFVSANLAKMAGLNPGAMLTGEEISGLRDEALWALAPQTELFVEIDPQQKERIVRALQRTGHCVGFLGDGINDVPALEAADVGISVKGAVDVARESADMVLFHEGLGVLVKGIEEGRRTAVNTLKYLAITTSANFGNMVSMALSTPWLPFLPLAPKQILLNNFMSDIPSLFISTDKVDQSSIAKPVRWKVEGLRRSMLVFGLHSSLFDIVAFVILIGLFQASQAEFQTAWFLFSLATELGILLILRTRNPTLSSSPSPWLLASTAVVILCTALLMGITPAQDIFGFVPVGLHTLGALLLSLLAFAWTAEKLKAKAL